MPKPTILNRIADDQVYATTYPSMIGQEKGAGATQEVHIFLSEINPSEERVLEYFAVTDEWNQRHPDLYYKMKPCFLALLFRDAEGNEQTVNVMQTSRYLRSDDPSHVVEECHKDAQWYVDHGFGVIREKIEASAHGIKGIPLTDEEMGRYPTKYFEFHIKVGRVDKEDRSPLTEQEIDQLREISKQFTRQFQIPIPLSYNRNRDQLSGDGQGHQRFLNARFRDIGLNKITPRIEAIQQAIRESGEFKVLKTISEYVWYDSYAALDHGWIDYTEKELLALMANLEVQHASATCS